MSSDVTDHNNTVTETVSNSEKKSIFPRLFALLLVMIGATVLIYKMPLSTTRNLKADTPQTYTVTNTNDSGAGSLRTAITNANSNAAGDTIVFESTLSGSISLLSELPELSDAQGVTIDGTTAQDGVSGPDITLNGGGGNFRGLVITSSGNTIKGLKITSVKQDGLQISGSNNIIGGTGARDRNVLASTASECCTSQLVILSGSNNQVIGNYIGVDSDGTTLAGNPHAAILLEGGGSNNVIGGATTGHRNVIGGGSNGNIGISNVTNTLIQNNYIGVTAPGTAAIGNTPDMGIQLAEESDGTQILQNVISGSTVAALRTNGADNVVFKGNYVGTNAAGTAAIANDGAIGRVVMFDGSSTNFTIGGTDINDGTTRNLISGNTTGTALKIEGSSTGTVQGNYIGLKADGTAVLANQANNLQVSSSGAVTIQNNVISGSTSGEGIYVDGTGVATIQNNYIGTNAAGTAAIGNNNEGIRLETGNHIITNNVISGNGQGGGQGGIRMLINAMSNITIKGNKIGTKADGTGSLGNSGDGINVGTNVTNVTIGGTGENEGNVIANNTNRGILLEEGTADLVAIRANTVFNNTNGNITFNGGANSNISSAATAITFVNTTGLNGTSTLGEGTAIDAFVDSTGGAGLTKLIGSTTVDADGKFKFSSVNIGAGAVRVIPTTTAGRSAEPSGAATVTNYVVNSTNDADDGTCDGTHCSLREAINASNASSQGDLITFSVSGTITINSALTALSSQEGVDLDGNSAITIQSTVGSGNNIFNLSGKNYQIRGFTLNGENSISGDGNTIGGVDPSDRNIFNIPTNGKHLTINSSKNKIINNYFGVQSDGVTISAANEGIVVQSGTNNIIGGGNASERNVFSGMGSCAINVTGNAGVSIYGNYLGLKADGSNKTNPVLTKSICFAQGVTYSNPIRIGGSGAGEGNVMSGNAQEAITLGGAFSNILIQGNYIGTNTGGTGALGNQRGINLGNSPTCNALGNCVIGGTSSSARNIISGNTNDGIQVLVGASNWQIINNYIGTNVSGTAAVGNGFYGINIAGGSTIQIGDGTGSNYNVISGNGQHGILVNGSTTGLTISSNYIGTNAAGTGAIANLKSGISLNTAGGPVVTVGTITASAPTNVISGNGEWGIEMLGMTPLVSIYSSIIGLNAAQSGPIGNIKDGIMIASGSSGSPGTITIGNTRTAGFNVIAGNGTGPGTNGINITNLSQAGTVKGNFFGSNSTMTSVFKNGQTALTIQGTSPSPVVWTFGGTNDGEGNVFSGHTTAGQIQGAEILIQAGPVGTKVAGNYFGVTTSGNGLGSASVGVLDLGTNTEIGSSTGSGRNYIGNMGEAGIVLASTTGTKVVNNYLGVKPNGTAIAGTGNGIVVKQKTTQATNVTIGGGGANEGNVISNWGKDGITIKGVSNVTILGNIIGLNPAGDTDFGNGSHGIFIEELTNQNIYIGRNSDKTIYKANIISGNTVDGIRIKGTGAIDVVKIAGNLIGTNGQGTGIIGNNGDGIHVESGTGIIIGADGTPGTNDPNVIGGNADSGIDIAAAVSGVQIQSNYVGVAKNGTTNIGNTNTGITLYNGANSILMGFPYTDTIVFDGTPNKANYLGFNGANVVTKGISVDGATTTQITMRGNLLYNGQNIVLLNNANGGISISGTTITTATTTAMEATTNLAGKCDVFSVSTSTGQMVYEGTASITNGKCTLYKDFAGVAGDTMVLQITQADGISTPLVTTALVDDVTAPARPIINSSVGSTTASYTFTGTKEAYSAVWYQLNGSSAVQAVPVDSATTWSLPVTLVAGENTGTFTSKDFAGNTSTSTVFSVNYTTTSSSNGTTSGGSTSGTKGNTGTTNNTTTTTNNNSTENGSTTGQTETTEEETVEETTISTTETTGGSGGESGNTGSAQTPSTGGSGGGDSAEESSETDNGAEETTTTDEEEAEEETVEEVVEVDEVEPEETQTPVAVIDEQLGTTVKEGEAPEWWLEAYDLEKEEFTEAEDSDADGVNNIDEYSYGTDPNSTDSDNDKLTDAEEVSSGTDPLSADSDDDGLSDYAELVNGTDPYNADTDGDGYSDGAEAGSHESDPTSALSVPYDADGDGYTERYTGAKGGTIDSDSDGITDILEYAEHTDPYDADTDKDGITDGAEILVYGTDPNKSEELNVEDLRTYIANWKNGDVSAENKPLVIGIAPASSQVELVYVQEEFAAVLGTEKSSTDGTFTITTESELLDGDYYLFARSRNATSGTIINQSYPIKITINTTTLDTESIAPQKLDGKEITDGEVITVTSMRPLLEVQSQLGLKVHVYWKSFLLASAVLADIDPWQTEPPSDLDVGLHTVYIQAEDSNNVKGKVHEVQFAVTPLEALHGSFEDKTTLVITVLGILGILAISLMAFYGRKKQKEVNAIAEKAEKQGEGAQEAPVRTTIVTQSTPTPQDLPKMEVKDTLNAAVHPDDVPSDTKSADQNS